MSTLTARPLKLVPKLSQPQLMGAFLSARDVLLQGSRRVAGKATVHIHNRWALKTARRSLGWLSQHINIGPVIRLSNYGSVIALLPMLVPSITRMSRKVHQLATRLLTYIRSLVSKVAGRARAHAGEVTTKAPAGSTPKADIPAPTASEPISRETAAQSYAMRRDYPAKRNTYSINH